MPLTLLTGNVQESKAQRQERLKSRFRDRGGIFVPSEENPLVDILLSRGVNGESPVKKRPPRKSKSALTPKSRSTPSRTKRTGAAKRTSAPCKSALAARVGDENYPPSIKKGRGTSKTPKLQVSERTNGRSLPLAAAQRKPFADQLADAINYTGTRTIPDSCTPSMKVGPAEPATFLGKVKHDRALDVCKAKSSSVLPPRYSDEPGNFGEEHVPKLTKCPALMQLERQGRVNQDGRTERQGVPVPEIEQVNGAGVRTTRPPSLHDQGGSSSDSSVPLAKKHAAAKSKRARSLAGTRTKPKTSKEGASPIPTKKRGRPKLKTLPKPAEDPSDKAALQEKIPSVPAKVPRKRKERVKASVDKDDNNNDDEHEYEDTHGLPQKKRRRADLTASRNAKENKETSRSAREAGAKMDKPLPSPVKRAARASPSKTKAKVKTAKPHSRARASAKSGTRPRGLPLDVRRRIEVIARNLPATDFDDDDPIDFLR